MKVCCKCTNEKKDSEFNKWSKSKDGLASRCKDCQRDYNRNLYATSEKRRSQIREVDKKLLDKKREKIVEYKQSKGCKDCGNKNPVVLDFDHLSDKVSNVSDLIVRRVAWKFVEAEIEKCEVVCANCHRIRTHNRRIMGLQ